MEREDLFWFVFYIAALLLRIVGFVDGYFFLKSDVLSFAIGGKYFVFEYLLSVGFIILLFFYEFFELKVFFF